MFIIIEKDELRELFERVEVTYVGDFPPETTPKKVIFNEISEFLNLWLTQENEETGDIDLLMYDETLVDLAQKVIAHIQEYIVSIGQCSWVRLIDDRGGLVIQVKKRSIAV